LTNKEKINTAILNSLSSHIAVLDKSGKIVSTNRAWENFAKKQKVKSFRSISVGANYLSNLKKSIQLDSEYKKMYDGIIGVLSGKEKYFSFEFSSYILDEQRWDNMKVTPYGDDEGVVIAYMNITKTIIAEKEALSAKEKLKGNKQLLRKIIDSSPNSIYIKDKNGIYLLVNKQMAKLHQTTPEKIVGMADIELGANWLSSQKKIEKYRASELGVITKKQPLFIPEEKFIFRNGKKRWFQTTKLPIAIGEDENCIMCVAVDISERIKTEEKIKESEEKMSSITLNSSDYIMLIGKDLKINFINRTVSGLKKEDVIGKHVTDFIPPHFKKIALAKYKAVFNNACQEQYLTEYITEEGETNYFDVRLSPVTKNGKVKYVVSSSNNITERKKTEDRVKDLANIVEKSLNEVYVFDAETLKFYYINDSGVKNLGYNKKEYINLTPIDIKPEFTRKEFLKTIAPLLSGKRKKLSFETLHLRKNKTNYKVEVQLQMDSYEGEKVFTAIINDITERKKVEEDLRKSAERFKLWKSSNFVGVIHSNSKGDIIEANDTVLNILGYSRQDMLNGKINWTKITPPEFLHLDMKAMEEAREKGTWTPFEKEYFHKDGHRVPIRIGGSVFKEASDEYIVFVIDLTERKKAELQIKENESKFRNLFNSVDDAIFTFDPDNYKIIDANEATSKIYGYEKDELIGMSYLKFSDEVKKSKVITDKVKKEGTAIVNIRNHKKKDGSKIIVQFSGYRLTVNDKEIMFGVCKDVTEQKKLEQEKNDAINNAEAREHARLALDLHDGLGQTIAAANMYFNSLTDTAKTQLDKEAYSIFKTGKKLINDATVETRLISQNIMPPSLNQYGLERPIKELIDTYNKVIPEVKFELVSNVKASRFVKEVELAAYRIIQEILNNSVKHSKASQIKIVLNITDNKLMINGVDDGIGFDVKKILSKKDTGMGLSNLSRRIDALGGELNIDSTQSKGTNVDVFINAELV
jgi:PAS domain S-box-containing protein